MSNIPGFTNRRWIWQIILHRTFKVARLKLTRTRYDDHALTLET
jgi:hypothetical protein